jgi:hypothetical protein
MSVSAPRPDPGLTPYQADFFARFVSTFQPGAVCWLAAPTGAGKSFAIANVVSELVRTSRVRRVLHVAPSASLVEQWGYVFGRFGQNPVLADDRNFRLLRETYGAEPVSWPDGILVIPARLAERADTLELLTSVPWDLVVFDETATSETPSALRARLEALPQAPARLLSTRRFGVSEALAVPSALYIDWHDDVAAYQAEERARTGRSLMVLETREYLRSPKEQELAASVLVVARALPELIGSQLLLLASSSVAALEAPAARLVNSPNLSGEGQEAVASLLPLVDGLDEDSRLQCALSLLGGQNEGAGSFMAVFCNYRATLDYLVAAVEDAGMRIYSVHGGLSAAECASALAAHREKGGVLVMTTAASEGVSLNYVGKVVHYDLPSSSLAFAQREGRYQRFGRSEPCQVYLLRDRSGVSTLEAMLLRVVSRHDLGGEPVEVNVAALLRGGAGDAAARQAPERA